MNECCTAKRTGGQTRGPWGPLATRTHRSDRDVAKRGGKVTALQYRQISQIQDSTLQHHTSPRATTGFVPLYAEQVRAPTDRFLSAHHIPHPAVMSATPPCHSASTALRVDHEGEDHTYTGAPMSGARLYLTGVPLPGNRKRCAPLAPPPPSRGVRHSGRALGDHPEAAMPTPS